VAVVDMGMGWVSMGSVRKGVGVGRRAEAFRYRSGIEEDAICQLTKDATREHES
jgi:hypothetical protein